MTALVSTGRGGSLCHNGHVRDVADGGKRLHARERIFLDQQISRLLDTKVSISFFIPTHLTTDSPVVILSHLAAEAKCAYLCEILEACELACREPLADNVHVLFL